MKPHQIIGLILIVAASLCFYFEHISRGKSDWTVIVVGLVLGCLGMWIGKFKFRKNKDGGGPDA